MRLGTWITVPHPSIVELLASQELDWLCVDLEHSPISRVELQAAVAIIQGKNKKAFARVSQNTHNDIKYPLDAGIDGIIIPMVNSAEEAKSAMNSCLYPPMGNRGGGLSRAQKFGFGFEDHLKNNLENLEIIVQIEHVSAVKDIRQILAIPRLTGVFLGPYDLSGSMGIPGQFDHPDMKDAIKKVADEALATGKLLGAHVIAPDSKVVAEYKQLGYNFIAFSLDTVFMGRKIADEIRSFNKLTHNGR